MAELHNGPTMRVLPTDEPLYSNRDAITKLFKRADDPEHALSCDLVAMLLGLEIYPNDMYVYGYAPNRAGIMHMFPSFATVAIHRLSFGPNCWTDVVTENGHRCRTYKGVDLTDHGREQLEVVREEVGDYSAVVAQYLAFEGRTYATPFCKNSRRR
jgi:hypothetical protein